MLVRVRVREGVRASVCMCVCVCRLVVMMGSLGRPRFAGEHDGERDHACWGHRELTAHCHGRCSHKATDSLEDPGGHRAGLPHGAVGDRAGGADGKSHQSLRR